MPDRFTALTGDVIGDTAMMEKLKKSYDIVLANIVADVIIPLAPAAASFLSEDSVFICSGILNTRLPEVLSALEKAGHADPLDPAAGRLVPRDGRAGLMTGGDRDLRIFSYRNKRLLQADAC